MSYNFQYLFSYLTIPIWGVYGAALGTIFAEFSVTIIQYYYMAKDIELNGLFKGVLKYLLFALISTIPCYFIFITLGTHIYTTLLQVFVAIIIYMFLLIVTKDELLMIFTKKGAK
ncbi:polysaccharide biosynthesis C-terminal domain-containing protein [Thomasclavelia spiroformis]|uniref:polysaccharide biosynthesis C-terminal domain-containing protein n=1 Tax=Thomasclavelia spiroformis TaxID=29348 RepID=UPI00311A3007